MAEEVQARHERLARLMAGELGQIFTGHLLQGSPERELTVAEAYLALYYGEPQDEVIFNTTGPFRLDGRGAVRLLQQFYLETGEAEGTYGVVLGDIDAGGIAGENVLDQMAYEAAANVARIYDVPMAVIVFSRTQDGEQKISYWYPPATMPDRLLRLFLQRASKVFGL